MKSILFVVLFIVYVSCRPTHSQDDARLLQYVANTKHVSADRLTVAGQNQKAAADIFTLAAQRYNEAADFVSTYFLHIKDDNTTVSANHSAHHLHAGSKVVKRIEINGVPVAYNKAKKA